MRVYSHENREHWPQSLINLPEYLIHFEHSFDVCGGFSLIILEKIKKRVSLGSWRVCVRLKCTGRVSSLPALAPGPSGQAAGLRGCNDG